MKHHHLAGEEVQCWTLLPQLVTLKFGGIASIAIVHGPVQIRTTRWPTETCMYAYPSLVCTRSAKLIGNPSVACIVLRESQRRTLKIRS